MPPSISPRRLEAVMSETMQLLAELPQDDLKLRVDSLEGETGFFALLDHLAEIALSDTKLVELARERIKRLEARADSRRNIIRRMLEIAEVRHTERPLYTASISRRQELQEVATNEVLPQAFIRSAPDKVLIKKVLGRGEEVPGYTLADRDDLTLTLRTS
jgi:uncharacterized tellurite resistance protein B-like protein